MFTLLLAAVMLFGAAALAEGVVLPDPAYYFGKEYGFGNSLITFDEYPEAEFDAYTALLMEKYEMVITDTREGDDEKSYMMSKPGIDGTKVSVQCMRESESEQYIYFWFGENISLEKLDVYTASSACVMCGGDGVCDTCSGKGYLEMKAYGSNDTVRVACNGGCAEGQCTACGGEQTTPSYTPPIVGKDGLLVMSPEQYLGIKPCDRLVVSYDGCYNYHYKGYGWEYEGDGSDENWAMMVSYVEALVDSGYYEISDHRESSSSERWMLRYIGPAEIIRGTYDIQVQSSIGNCIVMYRISTVAAADLQEKLIYFNVVDPNPQPDNPSIWKTCSVCNGDKKCRFCRGKGTDGITGGDCAVCVGGKCYACNGTGHE